MKEWKNWKDSIKKKIINIKINNIILKNQNYIFQNGG